MTNFTFSGTYDELLAILNEIGNQVEDFSDDEYEEDNLDFYTREILELAEPDIDMVEPIVEMIEELHDETVEETLFSVNKILKECGFDNRFYACPDCGEILLSE